MKTLESRTETNTIAEFVADDPRVDVSSSAWERCCGMAQLAESRRY
jgi:hypothetical protein